MKRLPFKPSGLYLLIFMSCHAMATEGYRETAQAGVPDSWRSMEFTKQWGLEAIGAQHAYARGYNGNGVSIGIFDESVFTHPEFNGRLNKVDANDAYNFDALDGFPQLGDIMFGDHGTHVAGIAAAARDGNEMHGVAFNAGLVSAKFIDNDNNYFEKLIQSDTRIFNNSWGDDIPIQQDEAGNDIFLADGRPLYQAITEAEVFARITPQQIASINELAGQPVPGQGLENESQIYAALLRAVRFDKLVVFAAGNENNYNLPVGAPSLPYFFPQALTNFIIVTNLDQDDALHLSSTRCGYTASYCLSAPGSDIYSTSAQTDYQHYGKTGEKLIQPGYAVETGTSMAAPMVSGAAAVLMQRFPYMTASQIATVLFTTASDLGDKGLDAVYGWGKLNLASAIGGPKMFVTAADIPKELYIEGSYQDSQFVANLPGIGGVIDAENGNRRVCGNIECGYDNWTNNIGGHGGLTKTGAGTLELSGTNSYLGPTQVNQGVLLVNGSVSSDVSVEGSGTLAGTGSVGSLTIGRGGNVAPGNPIAALRVAGDVSFAPGSRYAVEVDANGHSNRILSDGAATIGGGQVSVRLENQGNRLSRREAHSLLGQQYAILNAQQGVSGQFDALASDYLFIATDLSYQPSQVTLNVGRNATRFASVAQTRNEREVATAAEALNAGNPVYESILGSGTAEAARQAYRQLSGQIHADIATTLVNNSRYLRDTLNGRLRQAQGLSPSSEIKADAGGAWVKPIGAWHHASGDGNAAGFQASTYGVLLGVDTALTGQGRIGMATGYTRTSLHGGYGSNASSDNYHLATYGGTSFGALALRAGAGYSWHRIDSSRTIGYGANADRATAKYGARSGQLFAEAGYGINAGWLALEPFANLAYVNVAGDDIQEKGGAAALRGDKQHTEAMLTTLGLRTRLGWTLSNNATVALHNALGWQHQYGKSERAIGLRFNDGAVPMTVNSVPASRDGLVLKVGVEAALNSNSSLSLGYAGVLSNNYQDNSINAGLSWHF
ncbi:autotransporter outer membrane beta-barrel domain-containing protein [Serratia sp. AKBS12]|uniref:autotransporter outer membrane beta-barrel domain-containing protein n=1 Tax=Serratia sp. AKBS12 TaxID=2974597 RepID=UPI00216577DC|nr:autotransporter serine protease [Serratia sp. AKBS12]MCS3408712.1 autotransporter outer membrane beta-barrel domain-containing protein [Serratia sp. AKBS12]